MAAIWAGRVTFLLLTDDPHAKSTFTVQLLATREAEFINIFCIMHIMKS